MVMSKKKMNAEVVFTGAEILEALIAYGFLDADLFESARHLRFQTADNWGRFKYGEAPASRNAQLVKVVFEGVECGK